MPPARITACFIYVSSCNAISLTAFCIASNEDIFGDQPKFECLVAEVEQQVVGMALYYPRFSTWKGPTFHLEDLIVSEQFKGKGVGTQLYSAFIQQSYEVGVERIEWNVLDWNTPAVKFYEKSGAQVLTDWRTVQMHRPAMKNYLNTTTQ